MESFQDTFHLKTGWKEISNILVKSKKLQANGHYEYLAYFLKIFYLLSM